MLCHCAFHGSVSTRWLHRWHTRAHFDLSADLSLRGKFAKALTPRYSIPPGPHKLTALSLLSYHYKQKLCVDVIMHRRPVSLPAAGGHSKEAEREGTWRGLQNKSDIFSSTSFSSIPDIQNVPVGFP